MPRGEQTVPRQIHRHERVLVQLGGAADAATQREEAQRNPELKSKRLQAALREGEETLGGRAGEARVSQAGDAIDLFQCF